MTPGRRCAALMLGLALSTASLRPGVAVAQTAGDATRGEEVFRAKQCGRCHQPAARGATGPALEELRRRQGAYELTGRLWNHAPAMFTALAQEDTRWPEISAAEMADLMAYLEADAARDPAPDPRKGHRILVSKGCLKCHAYNREGATVAGDLADRRADFAPPAKWASTIWSHTPRIAAKAVERGILYPRFSGDEMTHLIAFLRSGPAR